MHEKYSKIAACIGEKGKIKKYRHINLALPNKMYYNVVR